MTDDDVRAGTDAFLQREGPPTFSYDFSQASFYMTEAFLPGRCWDAEHQKWAYLFSRRWHEMDLKWLVKSASLHY